MRRRAPPEEGELRDEAAWIWDRAFAPALAPGALVGPYVVRSSLDERTRLADGPGGSVVLHLYPLDPADAASCRARLTEAVDLARAALNRSSRSSYPDWFHAAEGTSPGC